VSAVGKTAQPGGMVLSVTVFVKVSGSLCSLSLFVSLLAAASQKSPLLHGCISCLLFHPLLARVARHSCQAHPPTLQVNEKQDIVSNQPFQGKDFHGEKIRPHSMCARIKSFQEMARFLLGAESGHANGECCPPSDPTAGNLDLPRHPRCDRSPTRNFLSEPLYPISSCGFYCLARLEHIRTLLSTTRVTTERDRNRISLQSGQTSKPSHQCCQIVTVLFIDRLELQTQSAAGLHVPHDSVGANLALLNKKMKIGRRANALWPGGLNEQSSYTEILHARQITISAAFPVDPYIVL